jgi:hypothetical protein
MKSVLFLFPTLWDRRQLEVCRAAWEKRFEIVFAGPEDSDCPWDFDPERFVEETAERFGGRIHGVASSSDYPGVALAAILARRLGLPGPAPAAILACGHKVYSRVAQRAAIPEATPRFSLVSPPFPGAVPHVYPCFIKPAKGAFSFLARLVKTPEELDRFLRQPGVEEYLKRYVVLFNRMLRAHTDLTIDAGRFLAEDVLAGEQITLEGYVHAGETRILGITDSHREARTGSFTRFEYPSVLDAETAARAAGIARRLVARLGIEPSFFNVEMAIDRDRGTIHVIEINPRICGQFADLYLKVDGMSSYEMLLDLVTGRAPSPGSRNGSEACAASVPLRVYEPLRLTRLPDARRTEEMARLWPGTLVWIECAVGEDLGDRFAVEDGASCRYAVVNLGAEDRTALSARIEQIAGALDFGFAPCRALAQPA